MQVERKKKMELGDKILMSTSSTETVKPSSPTPQHLQEYKLSMIDQISPPMVIPIVLYFNTSTVVKQQPDDENNIADHQSDITERLKRSLSTTLSLFHPLSGRINTDGQSINCNDQGVPFTVVKFTGHKLSDLLKNPDQNLPRQLLPCDITWDAEQPPDGCVALIQLSHFDCGGFAVGAVFWHKVGDAVTFVTFLQSWAAAAAAATTVAKKPISPDYTVASVNFPQQEDLSAIPTYSVSAIMRTGKSVMRRFVFDETSITSLKSAAAVATAAAGRRPSRVEVVSALLWRCFMAASLADGRSASMVTHAVDLRRRAQPPFPPSSFGNFAAGSVAASGNIIGGGGEDLGQLVGKIRDGISKVDREYVERMTVKPGGGGLTGYLENLGLMWQGVPEGADMLCMSSWCSMGLYDVDFGWGKPIWINRCDTDNCNLGTPYFINLVWLMDTRDGNGVEAWVTLDEKYMKVFDQVQDLRDHATVDPSPLAAAAAPATPPLVQIPLP